MRKIKALLGVFLLCGVTGCSKKKLTYEYKGKGYSQQVIQYNYNSNKNEWYKSYKRETIFDEDNNLLFNLGYNDYKKDKWTHLIEKNEYVYENNKVVKEIYSEDLYRYFENKRITEYVYDGDVLVSKIYKERGYKEKECSVRYKAEYTYDSNNNLIQTVEKVPVAGSDDYRADKKIEYTYNESNLKTTVTEYTYSTETNTWSDGAVVEKYQYDSNNNLIEQIYNYSGVIIDSLFYGDITNCKLVFEYDSNNRIQLVKGYDLTGNNFYKKIEYTYDEDGTKHLSGYYRTSNDSEFILYDKIDIIKTTLN